MAKVSGLRIFLAGATGVIGVRLLPLMLAEGHVVAAMTRTPEKINGLRAAGATPVLCDLFDQKSLTAAVKDFRPDVIVHQVTNLPDEIGKLAEFLASTDRVRSEGTRNLLAAAQAVNASGIAWDGDSILESHENSVVAAGGTILRYEHFYGPGTYYENDPPPAPRIHVDDAARCRSSQDRVGYLLSPMTTPSHETAGMRAIMIASEALATGPKV